MDIAKGKFLVIEGLDGVGKDTLLAKYIDDLNKAGKEYVVFRDPSSTVASQIRELLLNTDDLENSTRLYLYLAARSELIHKQIIPALNAGKTVICNRFSLSTYAYQGVYFTKEAIDMVHTAGGLDIVKPDLQIVLLSEHSFREACEEDVMGQYCNTFRQQITKRYLELSEHPEFNIQVIWADNKSVEEVYEEAKQHLSKIA